MTKDEKELIATIKVSLIRGIVGMDEEALLNKNGNKRKRGIDG